MDSIEGEFTYAVIYESYGGNLALSWGFKGKTDGFWIYDESGKLICETRNEHQHYYLIKESKKERSFVVKEFVNTLIGKVAIVETEQIYLSKRHYEKPVVSLVIPVYNAEDFIVRTRRCRSGEKYGNRSGEW